ncbi:MAG: hypothetical protein J6C85_02120 [Alphaproteobacteria bacterium]|nr:hypothetical protein [Alphaproteobacteria bacterium]
MEQIVLDVNLKYVLAALDMAQRGEILTALFEGEYNGCDESVKNIFCYFSLMCEQKEAKRRKMRELSALGVASRLKKRAADFFELKTDGQADDAATVEHTVNRAVDRTVDRRETERKEAKESIYNKNNIFYRQKLLPQGGGTKVFSPPDVKEVRDYVEKHGYQVNAETFVDFYDSRGWRVGSTPILNWQATVRLWHRRAMSDDAACGKKDDETYWHELMAKKEDVWEKNGTLATGAGRQNLPRSDKTVKIDLKQKPFERFMDRVETYDISGDEK